MSVLHTSIEELSTASVQITSHAIPKPARGSCLRLCNHFLKKIYHKNETPWEAKGQGNLLMHEEMELELLLLCLIRNNCPCWHVTFRARALPTMFRGISVMGICPCTQMLDFNLGGSCPTNVRGNGNRSEAPEGHCLRPSKFLVPVLSWLFSRKP